mgnify:FL=1
MRHGKNEVRMYIMGCLYKGIPDNEIMSELCHKMGLKLANAKLHMKKRKVEYAETMRKITVQSLMTGKDVEIPANTPHACRPDSETYWSM